MARKRIDQADNKLPPRVSKNKYSYYLKTKDNKTITLGPISMPMSELWAVYNCELSKQRFTMTFDKLWYSFIDSPYFKELAPRTQKDYHQHSKKLLKVFGRVHVDNIKPVHIRQYLDIRGNQSRTQANHELASMSRVYRWGFERDYAKNNPCQGVSKFSIASRDEYMEDQEYISIYDEAIPAVKIAMEIAYLCAVRIGDIIKMNWSQVLETGIFIQQGKTGTKQIKQWTERLKKAIDLARINFPPKDQYSNIIQNANGQKYSYKTFNTHWLDAKKKADEKLGYEIKGTFHDLKAKGISDFEGASKDKQLFSGHKTESQVLVYDRKIKISPTLDIKNITEK